MRKNKHSRKFNRAVKTLHQIYSSSIPLPDFHRLMKQYGHGFVYDTVRSYGRRWTGTSWVDGR